MRSLEAAAIRWGLAIAFLIVPSSRALGQVADSNGAPTPPADGRLILEPAGGDDTRNPPDRVVPSDQQRERKEGFWSFHAPVLYLQKPRLTPNEAIEANEQGYARHIPWDAKPDPKRIEFWPVPSLGLTRVYTTPAEIEMYNLSQLRIDDPGPELPAKLEIEPYHWLDSEYYRDRPLTFDYRARFYDCEPAGPAGSMGFTQQDLALRWSSVNWAPFMGAELKARDLEFTSRPILPSTGGRFPSNLSSIQAGVSGIYMIPPGFWNVTFGSASDKPFASPDEMTADVTYFLGDAGKGEDGTGVYVNWQNNRDYLNGLPIPGYIYRYKQGDWFTLVAGFPDDAFAWRPLDWLELAPSYSFPRTVHSEIGVRPCKEIKVFGGFDWTNERFFRSDRQDVDDRLWYFEKTLSGGVRWERDHRIYLEARGGWAFDRFWFEGPTYEDRSFNRINVGDGPFLSVSFGIRF